MKGKERIVWIFLVFFCIAGLAIGAGQVGQLIRGITSGGSSRAVKVDSNGHVYVRSIAGFSVDTKMAITATSQATIDSTEVQLISSGGIITIWNEDDTDTLRIAIVSGTCLTDGFGIPPKAAISFGVADGISLYAASSGTCTISYMKGD